MKSLLRHIVLCISLVAIAACSTNGGDFIQVHDGKKTNGATADSKSLKYAATLRVERYVDQRQVPNPRFLGKSTARISGLSTSELLLDRDVVELETSAIKQRFEANSFQVLEGEDAPKALFEVSGVIKELALNVDKRDEISIIIETTLKDTASGKVVWSGMATEKNIRFAGVSGNNKDDIAAYLKKSLRIVNDKTVAAISASLMAAKPELFTLTPGTKPIAGVDIFVAPPASPLATQAAVAQVDIPPSNSANGVLSIQTNPQRAKVYLDGVYFGLTPLRSEIEPGIHDVVVKLQGYKTAAEKVSVRKGNNTELELNLDR
jgi:hypothetical protein